MTIKIRTKPILFYQNFNTFLQIYLYFMKKENLFKKESL